MTIEELIADAKRYPREISLDDVRVVSLPDDSCRVDVRNGMSPWRVWRPVSCHRSRSDALTAAADVVERLRVEQLMAAGHVTVVATWTKTDGKWVLTNPAPPDPTNPTTEETP